VTKRTPVALTIAGSDSGAGAGVQADLKTFASLGVYGTSAITAVTAQNTLGVTAAHYVPAPIVAAQIDAIFADFDVAAIKIGMLGEAEIVETVARSLRDFPSPQPSPANGRGSAKRRMRGRPFVVYDPVMAASSGDALSKEGFLTAVKATLLPFIDCLTPNLAEAAALLEETQARDETAMAAQGRALLALGPRAILMKGGHLESPEAVDLLITREGVRRYAGPRIASPHTHGTGCTLSAAIAGCAVLGVSLEDAIEEAKALVARSIEAGREIVLGGGSGPLLQIIIRKD
jgi:hydroxymethylpyrimidine/phosphomethylpyrimidine kinase